LTGNRGKRDTIEREMDHTFTAPVPTMMTGLSASLIILTASPIAAGSGPGSVTGGAVMPPQAIDSFSTGVKRISIGKSSRTGPGAPELAVRHARLTSLGISPTLVIRWQNLVTGFARTTWSWKPWSALVSASRRGGEEVTQRRGLRSAKAVARPGRPLQNLV